MFVLNRKSDSYLYEQLYEQLKQQILSGNMKAGQRLPATRELAAEYQISRNTVINAYYQLEIEGYIKPVTGSGILCGASSTNQSVYSETHFLSL